MWRTLFPSLYLGLTWMILGCAEEVQGPVDLVVAEVGQESIYKRDVEKLISSLGSGLRSKESGDAARRDYLQSLIDQKLLVLAGRERGLDTSRTLKESFAGKLREKVINTYQTKNVTARIEITQEEMRQRFEQAQYKHEKFLSRIVVEGLDEAKELRRQIEQDADLDALAKTSSSSGSAAPQGGHLGYLNRVSAAQAGIAPQVFSKLSPGGVSEILPAEGSFELIYCSGERDAEFMSYREALYKSMWKEEFVAEHRALLEELASTFDLRQESAGIAVLVGMKSTEQKYPDLSPEEAALPIYVYKGGQITVGDYIDSFRLAEEQPALGDSVQVIRAAWKLAIPRTLVWEAARAAGHLETKEIRFWKQRKTEQLLIMALRQTEISEKVVIEDAAIRRYYEARREQFRAPIEVSIEEILLDGFDQATTLRQRLDKGETIADLSHLSTRHGAPDSRGRVHIHSYEKAIYGELVDYAAKAELGELIGPLPVKGGYSIFRVNERKGGHLLTFEDERRRIRAILRIVEEEKRFNELVVRLRREYADQVRVFEEVIPDIQLPVEMTPAKNASKRGAPGGPQAA